MTSRDDETTKDWQRGGFATETKVFDESATSSSSETMQYDGGLAGLELEDEAPTAKTQHSEHADRHHRHGRGEPRGEHERSGQAAPTQPAGVLARLWQWLRSLLG